MTQVSETGTGISRINYYAYDSLRRLERKDTPEGVLTYAYDARGSVQRMRAYHRSVLAANVAPTEATATIGDIEYAYDKVGRLKTVKNNKHTGSNTSTYTYDLGGNLRQLSYPNLVRHTYEYTEQSRFLSVQIDGTTGSPATLRRFDYTMDASGHRTSMDESAGAPASRSVQYSYSEPRPTLGTINNAAIQPPLPRLYRLTKETINPGANAKVLAYNHDIRGNRLSRIVTGTGLPPAQAFDYNENDHIFVDNLPAGTIQFAYDSNGNTTTSPTQADATKSNTDSYDTENRLVKRLVTSGPNITFGYDHDGHRIRRSVTTGGTTTTTYFLVDDNNPTGYAQVIAESKTTSATPTPSGAPFYQGYEYGLRVISQRDAAGAKHYYAHDALGSTRFVTDSAAAVPTGAYFDYDAYGNLINSPTTTLDIRSLFAGEQWDPHLGMSYNRARYYSPAHGRFWTMDSDEGDRGLPGSLHKYLYCTSDPLNRVDPSGYFSLNAMLVGAGVGGSLAVADTLVASRGKAKASDLVASFILGGTVGGLGGGLGSFLWEFGIGGKIFVAGMGIAVGVAGVADAVQQEDMPLAMFRGATVGIGIIAIAKGLPPHRASSVEIGNIGEARVAQMLRHNGYKDIWVVKNSSGNGLDIVARTPDGRLAFFEVKTSTAGNIHDLSPRQQNMDAFVRQVLGDAAQARGRYSNLSAEEQGLAARLLREYNADPSKVSGTVVGVDLKAGQIHVSPWPGRPGN